MTVMVMVMAGKSWCLYYIPSPATIELRKQIAALNALNEARRNAPWGISRPRVHKLKTQNPTSVESESKSEPKPGPRPFNPLW